MPDYSERVRVIQRSSGGHGLTGEKSGSCEDQTRSVRWPAPLRASALKRANFSKRATWWSRLFKEILSPAHFWVWTVSGASGRHDCCLTCLGIQHAEEAFVDGSCSSCGDMTISELRYRLRYVKHGGVPLLRSGVRSGTWGGTASCRVRDDLRITARASPSGVPHPSSTPQPAGVPMNRTGASAE